MSDIAIRCEGLSKQYRIGKRERYRALRDVLTDSLSAPFRFVRSSFRNSQFEIRNSSPQSAIRNPQSSTFWALNDVSFSVRHGEVVGIIGRNGAGKSTLLKILSRITEPTRGFAEINGRVGSLLEVGTGFHPELTGRENIYLNGAILGMKRAEIERRFDEIVDFAETEKFLDTPVKYYSSGMQMRLAFAVAAHLDPEILLVDEVLAVGDAQFQKKCLGKMGEVAKEGRTVLFVSHNMNAVTNLCSTVLWLQNGLAKQKGEAQQLISAYISREGASRETIQFRGEGFLNGPDVSITSARTEPFHTNLTNGMDLSVAFRAHFEKRSECNFVFYVYREGALAFVSSDFHNPLLKNGSPIGELEVIFQIPKYLLNPGLHTFGFAIVNRGGNFSQLASVQDVLERQIEDDQYRRGRQYLLGWNGAVSPILRAEVREVDS